MQPQRESLVVPEVIDVDNVDNDESGIRMDECPVCYEEKPCCRAFTCSHPVCEYCLEKMVRASQTLQQNELSRTPFKIPCKCPICRDPIYEEVLEKMVEHIAEQEIKDGIEIVGNISAEDASIARPLSEMADAWLVHRVMHRVLRELVLKRHPSDEYYSPPENELFKQLEKRLKAGNPLPVLRELVQLTYNSMIRRKRISEADKEGYIQQMNLVMHTFENEARIAQLEQMPPVRPMLVSGKSVPLAEIVGRGPLRRGMGPSGRRSSLAVPQSQVVVLSSSSSSDDE
jgi:hypothetical protein